MLIARPKCLLRTGTNRESASRAITRKIGSRQVRRAQRVAGSAQVIFRSVNKLLMDTATSEYLFCADFFSEDAVFHELFAATLAAVESHLATSVQVGLRIPTTLHTQAGQLAGDSSGFKGC